MTFNVTFPIPAEYAFSRSRMYIAPHAVDCDSEDTVAFIKPYCADGLEYRKLQNRRMVFDLNNDAVRKRLNFIDTLVIEDGKAMNVHVSIPFKKPDASKSYCCAGSLIMEDYTHVFFQLDDLFGSCNACSPFKFLIFDLPGAQMELTQEFYEKPASGLVDVPRDLPLKFKVGTAEYTNDPSNEELKNQLVDELKSYGDRMIKIELSGAASPDGDAAVNARLAKQRADKALQEVKSRINTRKIQVPEPTCIVYTWKDVADELKRRERPEAEDVYALCNSGAAPAAIYSAVKGMVIYDSIITPILEGMRVMKCSYTYQQTKTLDENEVVDAYYNNPEYREGGTKPFANGDFYNLLKMIKDDAEQKKIVMRAWRQIKTRSGYQYNKFAAYIANRMAIYAIDDPTIDDKVLDLSKFLDDRYQKCDMERQISFNNTNKWILNRRQLVANQAVIYMRRGKMDESRHWLNILPDNMPVKAELQKYYDMIYAIIRWDDTNLEPDERQKGIDALADIRAKNVNNNAVLAAELMEEMDYKEDYVQSCLSQLGDDNPRKWYYMSVLNAKKADTESDEVKSDDAFDDFGTGYHPLSENEQNDLSPSEFNKWSAAKNQYEKELKARMERGEIEVKEENNTPTFIAYIQHCFDLDKSYKKHFAREGLIDESVRKKFPYNPALQNKYRKKFNEIMKKKK